MIEKQSDLPILEVVDLSISFGDSCVLSNLSFSLKLGESLGIVGESGSGKSITALSLMGILPQGARVTSGFAYFTLPNENRINLLTPEANSNKVRGNLLSMIFQEPMTSLNPSMRCGLQVEEAIVTHNTLPKSKVKLSALSLLQEMQIPDPEKVYQSYPHELSGGQKQRVMIAMALASNPSILIADEPTTALDVSVQHEIINLLKRIIKSRAMSLLFISHDLGVISQVTNRLFVLKEGCLVEEGPTTQILTSPGQPYTQGLIASRPPVDKRPIFLPTVSDFLTKLIIPQPPERDIELENEKILLQPPILEVNNLCVDYVVKRSFFGKPTNIFRAVDNLSFSLYPGETLGLVGESGCGKTTLGRSILGLTPYQRGSIHYKGKDIAHYEKAELATFRQDVQLVFQDPYSSLNPRHTIGEAIMEPIAFYAQGKDKKQLRQRAIELLEYVALPANSFYRYPHEFSGGQRQRVAIARALSVNPKVLVCDEMVSALDVSVQAQILNLLNRLKDEFGLTYIFISHDLSVVKYMSNRMIVMQNGQIVESGFADAIYTNPQSEYTKILINSIPQL